MVPLDTAGNGPWHERFLRPAKSRMSLQDGPVSEYRGDARRDATAELMSAPIG